MAIEELVEEVATNLEETAEATRRLNTVGLGYLVVGLGIGAAVGFYFGLRFSREKIQAEAYAEAEEEVAKLREVYLAKTVALANTDKDSVEEIVERAGYSTAVPVIRRPLPAPVPVSSAHERLENVPNVEERLETEMVDLPEEPTDKTKSMHADWNYEQELKGRSPEEPYVIHQNEYEHSNPNYSKVVFTYYSVDDIIADTEDNHQISLAESTVGSQNLKFGHGADDVDTVYVRNDILEVDMKIERVNKSYEEEVLGLNRHDDDS